MRRCSTTRVVVYARNKRGGRQPKLRTLFGARRESRVREVHLPEGCTPWPADVAAYYRARGYWRGETLGAHLRRWAAARPKSVAIITENEQITYEDLDRRADILALRLT